VTAGIVVFAHGSRVESANEAVRAAAGGLARAGGFEHVEAAFLELGSPDLAGAVDRLYTQGLRRIVVVPYFLTLGLHMERDLPVLIEGISRKYSDLSISITPPLDGHPALIQVLLDRARAKLLEPPPLNKLLTIPD
jgi:sirohydrochlorin cobaltochelatase